MDSSRALSIFIKMHEAGIPLYFIGDLITYFDNWEGIRDLMELWVEETDFEEKHKIIDSLEECIQDIKGFNYEN